jgi:proteasome accessory factor C
MVEQIKIFRIIKLIRLLLDSRYTIKQLCVTLDISVSTIYKNIQLLDELGYLVEKDEHNRYFIFLPSAKNEWLIDREKEFLKEILAPLSQQLEAVTILKKLKLDHLTPTSEYISSVQHVAFVLQLQDAIKYQQWVILKNYNSSASSSTKDRLVLPLRILKNAQVAAYELESGIKKHYKIQRIQQIEISAHSYEMPAEIEVDDNDIFGMSGSIDTVITLSLSDRARNLLSEEYPESINLPILQDNPQYPHKLTLPVKSYDGVGRYILGLPGEIVVDSPESLRTYLIERIGKHTFL